MRRSPSDIIFDDVAQAGGVSPFSERLPACSPNAFDSPAWFEAEPAKLEPLFQPQEAEVICDPENDPRVRDSWQRLKSDVAAKAESDAQAIVDEAKSAYAAGLARLDEAVAQVNRVVASDVVELALTITKELVGFAAATDKTILAEAVTSALDSIPRDHKVVVRVNPSDLEYLENDGLLAGQDHIEVVADAELHCGGCIVDCGQRVIDASVSTRVDAVRASLVAVVAIGDGEETEQESD